MKKTKLLRKLLSGGTIVIPGGFSPLVGMIAEKIGYKAMYMSGFGTSAFRLGLPDVGLMSLPEALDNARIMARTINIPLIADADTGYGNSLNVKRTVEEFESAGVAGIQIEDQVWPKRCGHMEGKLLVPAKEMASKVRAAVDARRDPNFVIIARTDARTVLGYREAVDRANLYAESGADLLFLESPLSVKEIEETPALLRAPAVINMSEGGKTPLFKNAELEKMGYKVILWPSTSTWAAAAGISKALQVLKSEGTTVRLKDEMIFFEEFNKLLGLESILAAEKRYA